MAELPSSRKRVGLDGWTAMSGDSRRRDRPICLDRPERLFSPRFTMISQLNRTMEFLTALQSTEGGDCADAELATTKSDIARIYASVVLDPSRDQDWARSLGQFGRPSQSTIVRYRLSLITA